MFKRIIIFSFFLFMKLNICYGYEFRNINHWFDALEKNYTESVDFGNILEKSVSVLESFDSDVKLFCNQSKAFFYYQNQLTKTFILPQNTDVASWRGVMTDVLQTVISYSSADNVKELESAVLEVMTKNLDGYSRIGQTLSKNTVLDYTIKNDVLYVKTTLFTKGFADNLGRIVAQYPNIHGFVLDLRDNNGGQFGEAIKTADLFLDEGLIVYSAEKNQPKRFYVSKEGDILSGKPIVILTNERTASAAEIVTAALSEQSRATIIGTKTYGKGSIQQMQNIDDKTLYMTSGYFFSPSGQMINGQGIMPDICTGVDKQCLHSDRQNKDKDILAAIRHIRQNLS